MSRSCRQVLCGTGWVVQYAGETAAAGSPLLQVDDPGCWRDSHLIRLCDCEVTTIDSLDHIVVSAVSLLYSTW